MLGVMVSFVLARYQFAGRAAMYSLFAAGLMFPITVAITPLYILIKNLGLTNNLAGVILPADRVRTSGHGDHPGAIPQGDPG